MDELNQVIADQNDFIDSGLNIDVCCIDSLIVSVWLLSWNVIEQ